MYANMTEINKDLGMNNKNYWKHWKPLYKCNWKSTIKAKKKSKRSPRKNKLLQLLSPDIQRTREFQQNWKARHLQLFFFSTEQSIWEIHLLCLPLIQLAWGILEKNERYTQIVKNETSGWKAWAVCPSAQSQHCVSI